MPTEILNRQRRVRGFPSRELAARAAIVAAATDTAGSEVCVTLVSDLRMRQLNRDWRGKDRTTDVLSFAQNEGELADWNTEVLGDVIISLEAADRQREGRSLMDEVTHLLIHGVLHLLGHDHEQDDEAERMEAEERRVWAVIRAAESAHSSNSDS